MNKKILFNIKKLTMCMVLSILLIDFVLLINNNLLHKEKVYISSDRIDMVLENPKKFKYKYIKVLSTISEIKYEKKYTIMKTYIDKDKNKIIYLKFPKKLKLNKNNVILSDGYITNKIIKNKYPYIYVKNIQLIQ